MINFYLKFDIKKHFMVIPSLFSIDVIIRLQMYTKNKLFNLTNDIYILCCPLKQKYSLIFLWIM